MLDETTKRQLADSLQGALDQALPIAPLTQMHPAITLDDAYDIQLINVQRALTNGKIITGKKIGLTSRAMQDLMGVNEPDYGHLYNTMAIQDAQVLTKTTIQAKVEAEIAFVLKEDLNPGATAEEVLQATDYISPAIEVVDSRIANWKIKLADTVADNASSCCYILGSQKFDPKKWSLPDIHMTLFKNGEEINSGRGTDVLGNPATCVAWLAKKMGQYGVILKKGEVILSGALSAAVDAKKGDSFTANFYEFGEVSVRFV